MASVTLKWSISPRFCTLHVKKFGCGSGCKEIILNFPTCPSGKLQPGCISPNLVFASPPNAYDATSPTAKSTSPRLADTTLHAAVDTKQGSDDWSFFVSMLAELLLKQEM